MRAPAVVFTGRMGRGLAEAARPRSTTQIDSGLAPAIGHRFLAGADAVAETRVSQGRTAPPRPQFVPRLTKTTNALINSPLSTLVYFASASDGADDSKRPREISS